MQLRYYQRRAIDDLYQWFRNNKEGHPVLNMPGGSGKSVVIGTLVKEAVTSWPQTRVLMLVGVKELIQQNAAKLVNLWPNAPMGIYSASVGKRDMGNPITYAGIGSVCNRANQIGHIDLCIIDEVHAVNNKKNGMYRKLIDDLLAINPNMRLVGFTASPYRLGQGDLTEGDDALFTDILTPVTIEELVYKGYLCPLRSKVTDTKLSTEGIKKRGGEYVAKDMQRAFNVDEKNVAIASEIAERAKDRSHWLIFCAGIEHAEAMAEALQHIGIKADHLNGGHGKKEREEKLRQFETGEIQALCVVGMLSTGYDFPDLDCVVFLRATESPGLYLQCAVRAMRIKSHSDDALVLDFVGNVERHGPITCVQPPPKKGEEGGVAPTKDCPECGEIVHASLMLCPACGHEFPLRIEKDPPRLRNDDIMGLSGLEMEVESWVWSKHVSQRSGKEMLKVRYYGQLSDPVVKEYITLLHSGLAGRKALKTITTIASRCGVSMAQFGADSTLDDLADTLNDAPPPVSIEYRRDGQFHRVLDRKWEMQEIVVNG